jgi:hypothetical protein
MLQIELLDYTNTISYIRPKKKNRQKLHCSMKYDETSHEGRLFPLPAVVGWVAVVAGVYPFGGLFGPRALEPGGS